ncbi:hypothetical protein [Altericroceibacterium xinjiangense]|uniref:hypothetical protein n=1 Tax=Altericroceibacterium xinjiangense TaxID=762261 RepID=UPI000F7E5695|nr:hypothetical protein [Altericroceibacterium xinjiangense]
MRSLAGSIVTGALFSSAALACATAPAAAQDTATGSRVNPGRQATANSATAERPALLYRVIGCAVHKRQDKAEAFLRALDPEQAEYEVNVLLKPRECHFGTLADARETQIEYTASTSLIRGMTAEVLLKKSQRDDALQPMELQLHYPREWHALTTRDKAVDEMATCVADSNPQSIEAVLQTAPGGPEERTSIQALAPWLGVCLQSGYELDGQPLGLRSALAEALYYRTFHPEPAATADRTEASK